MRRTLSGIGRWFRVEHAGAPRWFITFAVLFAGILTSVIFAPGGH